MTQLRSERSQQKNGKFTVNDFSSCYSYLLILLKDKDIFNTQTTPHKVNKKARRMKKMIEGIESNL
jgi:hypothetical protein